MKQMDRIAGAIDDWHLKHIDNPHPDVYRRRRDREARRRHYGW